ncbi:DUF58 domain-containing protein [Brevibacterium jeotgali]|uniref:Uncharacterized conserved protein, DUF58 family, contains vWF domain n=1 Tax=Brevibacterium jeotgali TaxID=1262550 RepID=A0A2H1L657_9MICO|nr:DUF58 domain-containing protein [Brevibacterium jeotgali]TWC03563.1 uncharacterized protein (DUF58 family) [Brevibacterium jeotgali]SMY12386.1 Uncharacterized conserved protein, DUF58 family, contains vWF domain [Brevibacterium jeotgali]
MALTWRFLVLTAIAAVPIALRPEGTTFLVMLGVLAIIGLLDWLAAPGIRALGFQRTPGPRIRLGEDTHAVLTVTNSGRRRRRLLVRDAWAPTAGAQDNRFRATVRSGSSHERTTVLRPTRRGMLRADRITIRSTSWIGLVARQRSVDVPATITVLPPFHSRRHLPSKLRRLRELEGRTAVMLKGAGTEFDSLREYVRGDDVRSIDWRATARAQEVMVRTYRPERDRRVIIVLDSSRLSARYVGTGTAFDAAIESGLLLAGLAAGAGDRVDVLVADARVRARVGPLGRMASLDHLMHRITPIAPELLEADWETIVSAVMGVTSHRALVVFVTALDPATIAEDLLPALPVLTRRHMVAIASVADPVLHDMTSARHTTEQVYTAAAAERELMESRSLIHGLAGLGVHSVHEAPDDLPPALADLYIMLKSSGRL